MKLGIASYLENIPNRIVARRIPDFISLMSSSILGISSTH